MLDYRRVLEEAWPELELARGWGRMANTARAAAAVGARPTHEREDAAFEHLCGVLTEFDGTPAHVLSHPDRDGVPGGCDALIRRGALRVAAEHTCVHSISERPKLPHFWNRIAPPLRVKIEARFPSDWLRVWIPLFELPRPKRIPAMVEAVAAAVICAVPDMPLDSELKVDVPAFGFYVLVGRLKPHSSRGFCAVSWRVPGNTDDYAVEDMARAIRDKRKTLLAHRDEVDQTILLLESDECGFPSAFMSAFMEAAKTESLEGIDEVYFACTLTAPTIAFPFKWGDVLMPEPENPDRQRFHAAEDRFNAPHFEEERRAEEAYARELEARVETRKARGGLAPSEEA